MSRRAPLRKKEIEAVVTDLAKQGCKIERKTKGYWIGFPDGSSTVAHLTDSDSRAGMNFRSRVLRAGCTWLFDGDNRK